VCRWHQSIDVGPGRRPVVRASGGDLIYELRVPAGEPGVRLILRCDAADEVFVSLGPSLA
jgi:hypothetical protein